jgi:hypothetical protein
MSIDPTTRPKVARGTYQRRAIDEGSFAFLKQGRAERGFAERGRVSGEWRNLAKFPHKETKSANDLVSVDDITGRALSALAYPVCTDGVDFDVITATSAKK